MLLVKILEFNYLNIILASILFILLIVVELDESKYVYYNNIFKLKNQNLLSEESINMIVLTVTGDEKFLNSEFEAIYKDLYILHLLVLSGSNLVIFKTYVSLISRKDTNSYFVIVILALTIYYCYTFYLHPVARAFIFMTITEFINFKGYKSSSPIVIFSIITACLVAFIYFQFSNSFLLSFLFSFLIILYNSFFSFKSRIASLLSSFIFFPFFITISSFPIQAYFFNDYNLKVSLVSNVLIASIYDYVVFICYFAYFIGFFDPLSRHTLPLVNVILIIFMNYLSYIHNFIRIYN